MKKLLLSSAAMMLAFSFSAFAGDNKANKETKTTTEAPAETKATTSEVECYKDGNTFKVKEGNGICANATPSDFCTYIYTGDGEPGVDQNPLSYQPDPNTQGDRWQPL